MARQPLAYLEVIVKKTIIALALLLGTPLAAQKVEVGLFLGQQQ